MSGRMLLVIATGIGETYTALPDVPHHSSWGRAV
jgi:hypothetical protein